jgi:O-antigen/teichoic acid export membrane protein
MTRALGSYLLRGSGWAIGARIGGALCTFFVTILLSRSLTPEEYGTFFLALSTVTVLSTVFILGLDQAAVRLIGERSDTFDQKPIRQLVTRLSLMAGSFAVIASVAFLLLDRVLLVDVLGVSNLHAQSTVLAAWIVLAALQVLGAELFRGLKNIPLAVLFGGLHTGGALHPALFLVTLLFLAATGLSSLRSTLMAATFASGVIVLSVGTALYRSLRERSDDSDDEPPGRLSNRDILALALPLFLAALLTTLRTSGDLLIVGALSSTEDAALYGVAKRIVGIAISPLMVVAAILPPVVAAMYARRMRRSLEDAVRVVATVSGVISLPIFLILLVFGQQVIGILFGSYYESSMPALRLLLIGQAVNVLAGPNAVVLAMSNNQKLLMIGMTISTIYVLLMCSLVAPRWGAAGAAFAASSGLLIQNVLLLTFARWRVGFWTVGLLSPDKLRRGFESLRSTRTESPLRPGNRGEC